MSDEKLNGLIIEWLEVNCEKLDHINNQRYEGAAFARDKERTIEDKILKLDKSASWNEKFTISDYMKKYLSEKHGIDYNDIDMYNIKESIRQIKLNQLNIK